jgi:small conductance mechanosensitive channel
MTETVDRVGGPILLVIVIAFVAYVLLRIVGRRLIPTLIRRLGGVDGEAVEGDAADIEKRKRVATIGALVDWLFRLLIVGGATIAILIVLDLNIVIVAILVMIAVIGLVAKDVIRDYVAGVIILLENQFAIGDVVTVAGTTGTVEDFSLRRTTVRDMDGVLHTVPNSEIRVASNRTRVWAGINLDVTVAFGTDIERATRVVNDACAAMAAVEPWATDVLETPRVLRIDSIGELGVTLKVVGKVRAPALPAAHGELRRRLLSAFAANGIELPRPQRVVLAKDPFPDPIAPGGQPAGPSQEDLSAGTE